MESQERKRYSRQIIMPEIGLAGQEKLRAAKVLMIGAGGLGCPVLQYLVAAGVGTIGVVDDDVVDVTNLHRQILYAMPDIGKGKAQTAVERLSPFNPFVKLIAIPVRLSEENAAEIIRQYDLIIDGSDNFPTRYLANDVCVALDKPLVFGSILRFEGQVSVFNYKGGPTYRCLFPEAEEGDSCAIAGVLGILPGIIGTYMANEAIKIICEIGEILSGKLLLINALTNDHNIFRFERMSGLANPPALGIAASSKAVLASAGEISFDEFEKLQESGPDHLLLVDVREAFEFEEDFVGGINIPLPDLPGHLPKIPADKTIVFYCRSGVRSLRAANIMKDLRFEGVTYWMKER